MLSNEKNTNDLDSLIRQAVDAENLKKTLKRKEKILSKQLIELLLIETSWLQNEAELLINEFNDLSMSVKKNQPMKDWATLEVLLRVNKFSFAIEWRQNIFKRINGRWRVFYLLMKLNHNTLVYSFDKAKRAKYWELEKAMYLEEKFKIIRWRLRKLIDLKRNMRE